MCSNVSRDTELGPSRYFQDVLQDTSIVVAGKLSAQSTSSLFSVSALILILLFRSHRRNHRRVVAYVLPIKKGFREISSSRRHGWQYCSWACALDRQ